MALDTDEVLKIAHLARLQIESEQAQEYAQNLSNILDLVAQMNATDTSDVEPLAHPMEVAQRLRTDAITESNQREALQENSPATENGLFLVPKVIE